MLSTSTLMPPGRHKRPGFFLRVNFSRAAAVHALLAETISDKFQVTF
jgi:hypothetical protein